MSAPFFVGWSGRTGPSLGRFLALVASGLIVLFGALGYALAAFGGDPSRMMVGVAPPERLPSETPMPGTFTGVLERGPTPLLRLDPTADRPNGRTVMMSLWDKRGVPVADDLYGRRVSVSGVLFSRGDLAMLLNGGDFAPLEGEGPAAPEAVPLGRWRIAGEICDGKCYAGVMKPGTGVGHRACAALCFVGEVPAVFVASAPAMGARFFVLAGSDGGPPPPSARHLFGVPVELEGTLERRGDAVIFAVDFDRARVR